jgi:hypothetical protein
MGEMHMMVMTAVKPMLSFCPLALALALVWRSTSAA